MRGIDDDGAGRLAGGIFDHLAAQLVVGDVLRGAGLAEDLVERGEQLRGHCQRLGRSAPCAADEESDPERKRNTQHDTHSETTRPAPLEIFPVRRDTCESLQASG